MTGIIMVAVGLISFSLGTTNSTLALAQIAPTTEEKYEGHNVFRAFVPDDPYAHCAWDVLAKELCYQVVAYDRLVVVEKKIDYLIELNGGWEDQSLDSSDVLNASNTEEQNKDEGWNFGWP